MRRRSTVRVAHRNHRAMRSAGSRLRPFRGRHLCEREAELRLGAEPDLNRWRANSIRTRFGGRPKPTPRFQHVGKSQIGQALAGLSPHRELPRGVLDARTAVPNVAFRKILCERLDRQAPVLVLDLLAAVPAEHGRIGGKHRVRDLSVELPQSEPPLRRDMTAFAAESLNRAKSSTVKIVLRSAPSAFICARVRVSES